MTVLIYLSAADEGGETHFMKIDKKLTAKSGDAIMFFNLKQGCDGTNKDCVDQVSEGRYSATPTQSECNITS